MLEFSNFFGYKKNFNLNDNKFAPIGFRHIKICKIEGIILKIKKEI